MYQLASDSFAVDTTAVFIQTCTSMTPTAEALNLVRSATSLVRSALGGADAKPLRDFVHRTAQWCSDIDDVLAAAGHAVVDEMQQLSRVDLHDVVRRVAQIERDALASGARRDIDLQLRSAYAS